MKRILTLIITIYSLQVSAQDIIQMEKSGGVYKVPCKINGLSLKFIFDTGASDVSLSLSEALFMVKNGYLNESDFRGTETYRIANGDIAEGTRVILRKVEFGKQTLFNVEASIVHSIDAPLLLGQTVLQRLGRFSVDYSNYTLIIGSNAVVTTKSNSNTKTTSTSDAGSVTDINGKAYKTVKIGDQWWMAENLDVNKFRNGDPIPQANSDFEWENAGKNNQPAWCYYDSDTLNGGKYGKIYNWYAVNDPRGLAPLGWKIPSDADWTALTDMLGGAEIAGTKMKSKQGWLQNGNGSNESGFTGTAGGYRFNRGPYIFIGNAGLWWSSTEYDMNKAWYRSLRSIIGGVGIHYYGKTYGFSVRLVKE